MWIFSYCRLLLPEMIAIKWYDLWEKSARKTPAQNEPTSEGASKIRQIGTPEILENQAEKSKALGAVNLSQICASFRLENIENTWNNIISRCLTRHPSHFIKLCMLFLIYDLNSFIFILFGSSPNKVQFYVNVGLSIFVFAFRST